MNVIHICHIIKTQDHYDTIQDSIDAGLLDDIGQDYVLDVEEMQCNRMG